MNAEDSQKQTYEITLLKAIALSLQNDGLTLNEEHLLHGLPVSEQLTHELASRSVERIGYTAIWEKSPSVDKLSYPCCIQLKNGRYVFALDISIEGLRVLREKDRSVVLVVPLEVVQGQYNGQALHILPGLDLLTKKYSTPSKNRHWFWGRVLTRRGDLLNIVLASLFANILGLVTSLFAMQVYDRVIPAAALETLWVLTAGVGLSILFEMALRTTRSHLVDQIGKSSEIEIGNELFSKTISMKLDKRPAQPGAIVHAVREFAAVKDFFTNVAVGVVADLPFSFIFLFFIFIIAGDVVWIVVLGAFLIIVPNIFFGNRLLKLSKEALGGGASALRLLNEAVYGLETIKAARYESNFQRKWEEIIVLNSIKTSQQRSIRSFLTYWATSVQQATYVLSVVACVYMVFAGNLSVGAIIAIGILITRTLSPISQLSQALSSWMNMTAALQATDAIMTSEQDFDKSRRYIHRSYLNGDILVNKLRYVHPNAQRPAIEIEKFMLKAGARIGLLGVNGAGKSTLLRIVAGLLEQNYGEILFDGLDLRQIDPRDLRRNIGYLPQDVILFKGTIRENLLVNAFDKSDEEIFKALEFSGLHEFLRQHPDGLDLQIFDGGIGLSNGQRQSVGLARIFLQNPKIVLLDEPTSAFDQNLEADFVNRLGNWLEGRSCIIATHRLPILRQMTDVAVLEKGRLVAFGERSEILQRLVTPTNTFSQTRKI